MIFGTFLAARSRATARRMRADGRKGSASLEFALIAPVFFLLLMGIVENGVIYFAGSTLQYATDNAARYVRTGQAQTANLTQDQFRTRICNDIAPLLACNGNLQVDLQSYTGYSSANFTSPTVAGGAVNPALNNYVPGTACNVVLLRTFYTWHIITPVLSQFLTNMTTGNHLITATAAFRNEPFTSSVSGC
ncbi:MAG TPA: TadE/TadG family type IV pilus assembly protein [Rhizomicrobium sp.]|nr:TadE/TadG family type IV pilus assembly protein [Rhizomicrobium sp.]